MQKIHRTVFLSYRRKNVSWALTIYKALLACGFDVFFDYEGIAGGDFEHSIMENIAARAHFQPCPTRYEPEQSPYFQAAMSLKRQI